MSGLNANYWTSRWQEKATGWDIGYPSTPLAEYISQLHDRNIRILIPGCGNAYEAQLLWEKGFNHVLLDTPSVDKEQDGGKLLAHHAFWQYPENTNTFRTITELVFINEEIKDGIYLLNLQVAAFENDAAPSRPVLFQLI